MSDVTDHSLPDSLYHQDFFAWTRQTTELLRQGQFEQVDLDHLIEELVDMGNEQRRALVSQLRHLLIHLLKLRYSPAVLPRPGWVDEVQNARAEIADRLELNPSLQPRLPDMLTTVWVRARRQAIDSLRVHGETPSIPLACPFTLDQLLDEEFFPYEHS